MSRFAALGADPVFQQVQRDFARESFFDPMLAIAERFGIDTERGLALLFDIAAQHGIDELERIVGHVVGEERLSTDGDAERAALERLAHYSTEQLHERWQGAALERRLGIVNNAELSDHRVDWTGYVPSSPMPAVMDPPQELGVGTSASSVAMVQNALRLIALDPGPVNGTFGTRTESAVRAFQAKSGLDITGVVNAATWAALSAEQSGDPQ